MDNETERDPLAKLSSQVTVTNVLLLVVIALFVALALGAFPIEVTVDDGNGF